MKFGTPTDIFRLIKYICMKLSMMPCQVDICLVRTVWNGLIWLRNGRVAGSSRHNNTPWFYIKFLDWL
jgi:hypothetical protein